MVEESFRDWTIATISKEDLQRYEKNTTLAGSAMRSTELLANDRSPIATTMTVRETRASGNLREGKRE